MTREFSDREQKVIADYTELVEYLEARFGVVVTVSDAGFEQQIGYHLHVGGECRPETACHGFGSINEALIAGLEKIVIPAQKNAERPADLPLRRRRTLAA